MDDSPKKEKKDQKLGGTGKWVFTSSMKEALAHMNRVLDEVRENTARARSSQPKRRKK